MFKILTVTCLLSIYSEKTPARPEIEQYEIIIINPVRVIWISEADLDLLVNPTTIYNDHGHDATVP
jgi:hypothetical protein